MKALVVFTRLVLVGVAVSLAAVLIASKVGHGQSPVTTKSNENNAESRVKPTILTPDRRPVDVGEVSSSFDSAATNNAMLSNELQWKFGGKDQHGWYLYTSLISRLLNTEDSPS